MKKTRQIRKLNALKSVTKPCNAFCNATMYFLEPKKALRKSMIGWLLEAPTGPRDGRIWYDRMKEKRDGRLKALKEIQSHLATATSAMQDDNKDIFDKAMASIDKTLSDTLAESLRVKSPAQSVSHFLMQQHTPGKFQLTSLFRTPEEHQALIKRLQVNLRNNPLKLHKDIKLIEHTEPSDMIVPFNVTYKEDDKK